LKIQGLLPFLLVLLSAPFRSFSCLTAGKIAGK
jgi:hypothetical protein